MKKRLPLFEKFLKHFTYMLVDGKWGYFTEKALLDIFDEFVPAEITATTGEDPRLLEEFYTDKFGTEGK